MRKIFLCSLVGGLLAFAQFGQANPTIAHESTSQITVSVEQDQSASAASTLEEHSDAVLSKETDLSEQSVAEDTVGTTDTAGGNTTALPTLDMNAMNDLSPWGMYLAADWVVKSVMLLLLFASLMTWTICIYKGVQLTLARRMIRKLLNVVAVSADFSSAKAQAEAVIAQAMVAENAEEKTQKYSWWYRWFGASSRGEAGLAMVHATALELQLSDSTVDSEGLKERVAARLERVQVSATTQMNRGTGMLATVGSVSPFVGLFGTVWGIMNSFIGIAESQTTNLAVVAPGIAEALLATAIGLVAAIPAVIIYNHFVRAIGVYRVDLGDIATALLILVSRDLGRIASSTAASAEISE